MSQWDAAEKVSGTHSFRDARNEYAHSFWFTTTMPLAVSSDDTIFTWVRLDPCDPPQEILLEFFDGSGWEHRAFWGTANILQGGAPNTAAHRRMGAMPPAGEWVRLEIPASLVGVMNVHGMRFVLSDGNAWWDRVGHAPSQQALAASDAHVARAGAAPRGRRRAWWARLFPAGKSEEAPINMSLGASYVSDSSTERRYSIYSPALQLLAETATTSASAPPIANESIWFGGEPLAQVETTTGAVHWYFNDHLGAPVLTTSSTGSIDWRVEREPYGAIYAVRAGADRHQPLGLPGQEYDASSDRQYNVFRWYRAGWGRYTQADPIPLVIRDDEPVPANAYGYGTASPLDGSDPVGLSWKKWLPNPWGCTALTDECHKDVAKCQQQFNLCFLPYNDGMLDKASTVSVANPAYKVCFEGSETCRAMVEKCTMATNPAMNKPGKWKELWDVLKKWPKG